MTNRIIMQKLTNPSKLVYCSYTLIMIYLSLCVEPLKADNLTFDELKQIALEIKATEKKLANIKIDSEAWVETKTSKNDPCESWKKTPVYISTTGWFDGSDKRKGRVDFHKEVLRWEEGTSDYFERRYSVGFDGQYGREILYTQGYDNKVSDVKECKLLAKAPESLSEISMIPTGRWFTIFFTHPANSDLTWSEFFQLAADNHPITMSTFEFKREEFQNEWCVKVSGKKPGGEMSYWLNPAKGYALVGYKNTGIYEDGSERIISIINVAKLKEVSSGLWWPTEATIESDPREPNDPYKRTVYKALKVVANDPNFDNKIFTLTFPKGYKVEDKITGKTYVVDANSN